MKEFILTLPNWLMELLDAIESEGCIKVNHFISHSLFEYVTTTSGIQECNMTISNSPKRYMAIAIPEDTAELVIDFAERHNVQFSDLVFVALSYAVPILLDNIETVRDINFKDIFSSR